MRPDIGPVVVTGSGGFVGRRLAERFGRFEALRLGVDDWRERVAAVRFERATVFHLAARVHRPGDDDDAAYRRDNVDKTRALAETAAAQGARRLVFLSTVKVIAEESAGRPISPADPPAPADAYARSKHAAELALADVARASRLEVIVVRSPLVIGAGARGNLLSLLRLADSSWPLPFAAIRNRRTMIQVDDLADLLVRCALLERASGGRAFLAGDPAAVATPALVEAIRGSLGHRARLFPVPVAALEAGAALVGRGEAMRRLTRDLELDVSETMRELEWHPRIGIGPGIERMAAAYGAAPR
jgi:nucleoside-diphosphate-sugar epimerase